MLINELLKFIAVGFNQRNNRELQTGFSRNRWKGFCYNLKLFSNVKRPDFSGVSRLKKELPL
ncbi:hypothetical protein DIU38_030725 [Mucilaginibacter sp. P4]|uniref:hypothetical protein n=1 Tax=Mucilaginibacter TaxID=423349 RepID=UPI0011EE6A91|nr:MULTISPECIES: hypothetical protein [Mucilaginibacter]QEM20192.1 hypothetical protein DIU38_030725 [Mucilaginibacter gossypii]QTE43094.1 hypothetical protein J3L19_29935 [Mucilaginibacter rubeus]